MRCSGVCSQVGFCSWPWWKEGEPIGTGSYAVRIYSVADSCLPYDHFVADTVRPRDGTVEDVRFADLDCSGSQEVIVVIRSAGSGGYLTADAFRLRAGILSILASPARRATPIWSALKVALTKAATGASSPVKSLRRLTCLSESACHY